MRDSRIGSFGAIALFLALALKIAALSGAAGVRRQQALYLAPGLARWAMVMVAYKMPYLRDAGAGTALLGDYANANLRTASIFALVGTAIVPGWNGLRAAVVALGLSLALRCFFRRWLGGVTGDVLGAAAEIVETAVMLAVAN
jgi:adenosylcobinamide-GDP ribazoletransferase